MDAHEASYSITLMANVLGVTRAGYDAWKSQAAHRGQRALARRRLDEDVAWEHEMTGGTYAANPPSNTNYTKRPGQQPHEQTVNNLHTVSVF